MIQLEDQDNVNERAAWYLVKKLATVENGCAKISYVRMDSVCITRSQKRIHCTYLAQRLVH